MKVTPETGEDATLEEQVRAELVRLRKQRHGLTVESLAQAHTICALLGAGDPYVAHSRLVHEILESDLDISIQAVAASIGLSSDEDSHLKRLDEFGASVHLDQRQVRRHSDRGLLTLARLIATNWPTETVPRLTAVVGYRQQAWDLVFLTERLQSVSMSPPQVEVWSGPVRDQPNLCWHNYSSGLWDRAHSETWTLIDTEQETSVSMVWRGELWPKWNVEWNCPGPVASSESVGNKLMLRLRGTD
jgi:hypothetical protein